MQNHGKERRRRAARTLPGPAAEGFDESALAPRPGTGRPFVDGYLLYLLARGSAAASRQFHSQLAGLGVAVPVWRVLAVVQGHSGIHVGPLAEAVLLKQPTLTRVLDRMERHGLVKRMVGSADRRKTRIGATAKGRRLAERLIKLARSHERELLTAIGVRRAGHLLASLHFLVSLDAYRSGASKSLDRGVKLELGRD
jgi:DNA-binding MarR family transcriptional regulator